MNWKLSFFLIIALLAAAAFFEYSPAMQYARSHIAFENYEKHSHDCFALLDDRSWYAKFNHWLWLCLTLIPVMVFSAQPKSPLWLRLGRLIAALCVCTPLAAWSLLTAWNIRNDPFDLNNAGDALGINHCMNTHDSSIGFADELGWVSAVVYVGLWETIWYFYHRKFSKKITPCIYPNFFSSVLMTLGILGVASIILIILAGIYFALTGK